MSIPIHLHGMIIPAKTKLWLPGEGENPPPPQFLHTSYREDIEGLLAGKAEGLAAVNRNTQWELGCPEESDTIPELGIVDGVATKEIFLITHATDQSDCVAGWRFRGEWAAESLRESPQDLSECLEEIERDIRKRINCSQGFIEDRLQNEGRVRRGETPSPVPFCALTLWNCEGSTDWESGHFEMDGLSYAGQGITTKLTEEQSFPDLPEEGKGFQLPKLPKLEKVAT
jgi:hypothetical protein